MSEDSLVVENPLRRRAAAAPDAPAAPAGRAHLSWRTALEYRVRKLPGIVNPATGLRELLPYSSKTGRFCPDDCCSRACDPCGQGVVSAFVPFGSFVSSYFKLEVGLLTIFTIMSALALPAIVINTFGGSAAKSATAALTIGSTTIGNLPLASVANSTVADAFLTLPGGQALSVASCAMVYSGLDIVAVVCFLLFVGGVRHGMLEEAKQVSTNALGAETYSVFLPHVPHNTTEAELRAWAMKQTATKRRPHGYEVADVHVVDDDMGLLRIFERRGDLMRALTLAVERRRRIEEAVHGAPNCWQRYQLRAVAAVEESLKAQIENYNSEAKAFKSSGATAAFITFDSAAGPRLMADRYPDTLIAQAFQPPKRYFKEEPIVVRAAPAPGTVLWANLNIKEAARCGRQTLTGLMALTIILLSFVFVVFASIYSSNVQKTLDLPDCTLPALAGPIVNGTVTALTAPALPAESDLLKCFCATAVDWSSGGNSSSVAAVAALRIAPLCPAQSCVRMAEISLSDTLKVSFCANFFYSRALALGLVIGAALSIAVVNILLSMCMRAMSGYEGHSSLQDLNAALVMRLFLAQLFNTALLQIIINAAWDTITSVRLPLEGTGQYDDFSPGWYRTVGASFHSTMLTLAISPHVGTLVALFSLRRRLNYARLQVSREDVGLVARHNAKVRAAAANAANASGAGGAAGVISAADAGVGANAIDDEDEAEFLAAEATAEAAAGGSAKPIEVVPVNDSTVARVGLAEPAGPRSHAVSHTHLGALAHLNSMHSMRALQQPPEAPPRSFATQEELNWRQVDSPTRSPARPHVHQLPTH